MKKTFLFLTMTLLFFIGSGAFNDTKAQDVVTIGDENTAIEEYQVPISTYNSRGVTQSYYLKDEIKKDTGMISSIAFHTADGDFTNDNANRSITIYMRDTTTSSFADKYMAQMKEKDLVFSGNVELKNKNNQWVTIDLTTPFEYKGNNILLCIFDNTGSYTNECYFKCFSTTDRSKYNHGSNNTTSPVDKQYTGTSTYSTPIIQFTFESEGEGGETPEPETPSESITLSVDKETIVADGSELATFTVKHVSGTEETDVTANCTFYQEVATGRSMINNPFSTTTAGTYTIYAKYTSGTETLTSNEITVKATEQEPEPIILSASKTNLEADGTDAVIFTVMQGTNNITSDCEIWYGTEKLNGSTFSTTTVGSYKFYAMYGNLLSNEITINAEHSIYISVDKETIVADGTDYVTFTLTQGTEDITDDTDVTFFVDGTAIDGNTYSTTKAASYQAYAMKGEMLSNIISFTATKPATPGNGETVFTPYGAVTYNKGMENEYTLLVDMTTYGGDAAVIMEDNVNFSWGDATNCGYVQDNTNKPNAETSLTIPAYVLNGTTKWIPVTEIADYAFDSWTQSLTDLPENEIEPGNERNDLFTSLVIPNTVTNIGQFAFSCELEGPIFCYASTPPTCEVPNNIYYPFLTNTYNNAILYVPAGSIDAYKTAAGWSRFKTIAPLTISTFENKVDDDWANADNWKKYIEEEDGTYTETWGSLPNAGEDVLINGDAVIPAGYTANVGAINIVSGGITVKDGAQLVHTNAGVAVTVEKEIEGYATREVASTAWHTISSPIAVMTPTNNVNGLLNGAYDLYYYDEPTHYWINHEQETNEFKTLDAGRGYLYANENDVTLKFNGVINYDNVSFKLDATSEYEGLRGFNLIGNPFTHNIHLGANIYSENLNIEGYYSLSKEGQWGVKKASDEAIAPCQGVLVYTNAEETINIVKVAAAPATRSAQPALNITVANEQYDDNAYVLFKEGQGLNKINHMNENIPMVYVISDNEKFAIANVNDSEEIALGFEAMTMGEYTIAVKAQDCKFNNMILTDNITGEKTNLMTDSYTFMATTNDEPNRFTITLNADNGADADFIYINNNEMIINNIEGNGLVQIYDMMGRSVATYNVSGSANISMETLSNGVYVVRMTDDNGVKTQKVVNN